MYEDKTLHKSLRGHKVYFSAREGPNKNHQSPKHAKNESCLFVVKIANFEHHLFLMCFGE